MLGLGGLSTVSTVVLVRSETSATVSREMVPVAVGPVLVAVWPVLVAVEAPVADEVAPSVKATPRILVGSSGRGSTMAARGVLGASAAVGGSSTNVDMVLGG
jgi:hypothetical protein